MSQNRALSANTVYVILKNLQNSHFSAAAGGARLHFPNIINEVVTGQLLSKFGH